MSEIFIRNRCNVRIGVMHDSHTHENIEMAIEKANQLVEKIDSSTMRRCCIDAEEVCFNQNTSRDKYRRTERANICYRRLRPSFGINPINVGREKKLSLEATFLFFDEERQKNGS